ncbi:MAG: hypothetical protein ACOCRK_08815, partial [bacterium]
MNNIFEIMDIIYNITFHDSMAFHLGGIYQQHHFVEFIYNKSTEEIKMKIDFTYIDVDFEDISYFDVDVEYKGIFHEYHLIADNIEINNNIVTIPFPITSENAERIFELIK